ncbi:N(2)-fixation sustaining protein CowN [Cohaesibacter haloalkalitolerans]|uniref:N(2)-fixation sustaining protein CowN n=1 Tax=Cohaesibacter haloalkalitolerans TaxID=1162980 RepID=UPI000E659133|nr:N(2)-fixation sustaining protein CowN [Cohaesibacter haloalkalitolerans]
MSQEETDTDRYVSFIGIECDRNAERIVEYIERLAHGPAKDNAYWQAFLTKIEKSRSGDTATGDALFLVHSHINLIRDLFEDYEDEEAAALLEKVEIECC